MSAVKVLIIDDEYGMRWALEKALREEGYEVSSAANGAEGLEALASQDISLVLLDYKMPGMSGLKVLELIKETKPDLRVIFMTGHSSISTALDSLRMGATAYITKPFHLTDLKATINKVLDAGNL
ncbi:MAG: sigma-54-dependent transcriptional regulator [Bacillota bacterium]